MDTKTSVTVASVGKTEEPEAPADVLLSESEEANYENLTFKSFGIADGPILTQGSGHVVSNVLDGDLNEVLFQGKYLFPALEQAARFGNIYLGKANYYAITLTQDSAGHIMLDVISSATNKTAVENSSAKNLSATNDVQLRNNPDLEIAISIKYENTTSTTTDLKIGVWLNGVLSKGGYIYAKAVPLTDLTRCFHTTDVDTKTSVTVSSVGEVVEPEKILLSESEEAAYEKLTFANFGVKDGEILSGNAGEKITYATLPGTLDGILFQGKYVFPAMATAKQLGNIYLGRPDWWAIGLTQDSAGNMTLSVISDGSSIDNKNLCNLTAGNPTIQFRENEDLEIAISVKYLNTTATTTDLEIGVWINGVLQQGQHIYARNVLLSDLVRCLHTYDSANGCGVGITSVGEWTVHTLPTNLQDITLSDGNIPDGNTVTWGKFSRISSLDQTLFSANVQFNAVGSRMHLGSTGGAENAYSGLGLRLEKNGTLILGNELASNETVEPNELTSIGLNFLVISPSLAGMGDTFAGKEFLLQISTEFVDYDGGGENNDIKLGIFFNGELYCNNYIYIPNEAQSLGTGVNFNGVNEVDFARFSAVVIKEMTTTDLGIQNGSYASAVYGGSDTETLDRTAITAYVTFADKGSIAYGSAGNGIVFTYMGSDTVQISHSKADGTSVNIGTVEIPGGRANKLRTTFEFIKAGEQTNLKMGVYVNGKLANYRCFVVEDVDKSVLTRGMSVMPSGSAVSIGANSYETITLRDFIVADKARSDYGGRFYSYDGPNYNNTAFSAVITFSDETNQKNGNCFYVGGKQWAGVRVELDANGALAISFVHGDGVQMKLANIKPEDVGMTTFQGKAFTYRVTFDVVETASGQTDAIIGVYVNDTLCQGKHLTVKGVDPVTMERGIFSYVDKNGGNPTENWQLPVDHPDCIATKEELKKIMYFWMDMGVDGFRVDLAPTLIKGDKEGNVTREFWHELKAHVKAKDPDFVLVSEWGKPARAVWTGFDCDFLLHSYHPAYTSLFRHEEGRNVTREYIGDSYFDKAGKGDIRIFLDHFLSEYKEIGENGNIGLITGNHDLPRIGYGRTQEEMKVAMAFVLTMPGVPFVYYGDEIGMDFAKDVPSKEGGYIRTGARTPMQWQEGKNHGFSDSDTPYLPTDSKPNAPTVATQLKDEDSLLNMVKTLVKLRTQYEEFSQVSNWKILEDGYPFVYERTVAGKKFLIALNPADRACTVAISSALQVVVSHNVQIDNHLLRMGGISCIVAEEV